MTGSTFFKICLQDLFSSLTDEMLWCSKRMLVTFGQCFLMPCFQSLSEVKPTTSWCGPRTKLIDLRPVMICSSQVNMHNPKNLHWFKLASMDYFLTPFIPVAGFSLTPFYWSGKDDFFIIVIHRHESVRIHPCSIISWHVYEQRSHDDLYVS